MVLLNLPICLEKLFQDWNEESQSFTAPSDCFDNDVLVSHEQWYCRGLYGRHFLEAHARSCVEDPFRERRCESIPCSRRARARLCSSFASVRCHSLRRYAVTIQRPLRELLGVSNYSAVGGDDSSDKRYGAFGSAGLHNFQPDCIKNLILDLLFHHHTVGQQHLGSITSCNMVSSGTISSNLSISRKAEVKIEQASQART